MLNARQQAFVNEYARGGFKNASEAAVKAGYSAKTADRIASRLLKNVEVRDAVEALRQPAKEEAVVDAAFVFSELKELAKCCARRVPKLDIVGEPRLDLDGNPILVPVDAAGANAALKTLSQCLGMGREQVDKDQTIQTLSETLQDLLRK